MRGRPEWIVLLEYLYFIMKVLILSIRRHVVAVGYYNAILLMISMYAYTTPSYVRTFTPSYLTSNKLFQSKPYDAVTPTKTSALIPETNPYANSEAISVSGVKYQNVFHGLLTLYPPKNLDERNAMSRTDAYWPYIQKGLDPPSELTYGEFDFYFFAQLLDRAITLSDEQITKKPAIVDNNIRHNNNNMNDQKVFCDIGSGTGRLVFAAATLHPQLFQLCRGVELLPNIHNVATDNLQQCRKDNAYLENEQSLLPPIAVSHALPSLDEKNNVISLPMAPIQFDCGSFDDPYNIYYGDADIIFIFSSCMGSDLVQDTLAKSLGRQCPVGTIIITTDYMLPLHGYIPPNENDERIPYGNYRLKFLESVDGWCWLTGGASTAYIHLVELSLQQSGKIEPIELSLEDKALEVVHALESGTLSDYKTFVRNVRNNMIFNGFPECFLPKLPESG